MGGVLRRSSPEKGSASADIFTNSDHKQQPWRDCGCKHSMWKQRQIQCGAYILLAQARAELQC